MKRPPSRCLFFVGREISYCTSCGHRLLGSEGRGLCATCRPATPPPMPAPPRRLRLPRETTRIRKRSPFPLAIAAAAVLALAIGIAVAAGGSSPAPAPTSVVIVVPPGTPAPAPTTPAPPSIDETLSKVREMRGDDLLFERREEIRRMLTDVAGRAGTRLEEVDQVAADYDRKYEEAAARLADFTRSEAHRMASKGKFAEAIERVDGYPASFRASKSADGLRLLRQDLERRRAESVVPSSPSKRVL